jgi:hypothetical protein
MRRSRIFATVVMLPVTLLGAVACTASSGHASDAASTSRAPSEAAAPPPPSAALAGSAEAQRLAALPDGQAKGTTVLAYSGVGEVRAPFTGQCSHRAGTTRVAGSADTAAITVDVTPAGARVTLKDVAVSATSALTTGRYIVTGRHLSLAAHLAHDGQPIGSIQLEVDCGP